MPGRDTPAGGRLRAGAAAALVLFLAVTAAVVAAGMPYSAADLAVSRAVQSARSPALDAGMAVVSLAGDYVWLSAVLVGIAFFLLLGLRARREAAVLLGAVLVAQAAKIAVKWLVGRPRPANDLVDVMIHADERYSFPSGHTVHYTAFFGLLTVLACTGLPRPVLRRFLVAVFAGMVLLVGPARVYLGAHWVSDVAGGYLLGGAILAAAVGVLRPRE